MSSPSYERGGENHSHDQWSHMQNGKEGFSTTSRHWQSHRTRIHRWVIADSYVIAIIDRLTIRCLSMDAHLIVHRGVNNIFRCDCIWLLNHVTVILSWSKRAIQCDIQPQLLVYDTDIAQCHRSAVMDIEGVADQIPHLLELAI